MKWTSWKTWTFTFECWGGLGLPIGNRLASLTRNRDRDPASFGLISYLYSGSWFTLLERFQVGEERVRKRKRNENVLCQVSYRLKTQNFSPKDPNFPPRFDWASSKMHCFRKWSISQTTSLPTLLLLEQTSHSHSFNPTSFGAEPPSVGSKEKKDFHSIVSILQQVYSYDCRKRRRRGRERESANRRSLSKENHRSLTKARQTATSSTLKRATNRKRKRQ